MSPVAFAGLYRLPPGLYDLPMAMLDSGALVGGERALLKYAAERGGDRSVLRTVGVEAESDQR